MPHYRWVSCVNLSEFEPYSQVIHKVLDGHAAVDKINGHGIYKTRINQADRLFWITTIRNGQAHMEIVEVILNHDYQKSRFLKPGVLKRYLEKHGESDSNEFSILDDMPCVPAEYVANARYYDKRFILFTPDQQGALTLQTPVVITGAAGAGKSCVLFAALQSMCKQMEDETEFKPVLYVAQSAGLVKSLQSMWGDGDPRVLFLSYDEMIMRLDADCVLAKKIGSEYFDDWLSKYIASQERACTVGKVIREDVECLKSNLDSVLQEFRVIAAFTAEEYLSLGARHSLFPNAQLVLLNAYKSYQKALPAGAWDPAFYTVKSSQSFYGIAVDESLDLSMLQLLTLNRLADSSRIYFAMDSHQRLRDRRSHRPLLLDTISKHSPVTHIKLNESYRCSNAVIKFANSFIAIKTHVAGGLADRDEVPELPRSSDPDKDLDAVVWMSAADNDQHLKNLCTSPETAVVTWPEYREEARLRYDTPLIFTPEEIKGLGYKNIICWRLLEDQHGHAEHINNQLQSTPLFSYSNRSKSTAVDDRAVPYLNNIITAITRATGNLFFVQTKIHKVRNIVLHVQDKISSTVFPAIIEQCSAGTPEEWRQHADFLLEQGKSTVAQSILKFACIRVEQPVRASASPTSVATHVHSDVLSTKELLSNFTVSNIHAWLMRSDAMDFAVNIIKGMIKDKRLVDNFVIVLKELERRSSIDTDVIGSIYQLKFAQGNNIIHLAAINNHESLIEMFSARDLNIHTSNIHGITPLYLALMHVNLQAINALMLAGANVADLLYPELDHWVPVYTVIDYSYCWTHNGIQEPVTADRITEIQKIAKDTLLKEDKLGHLALAVQYNDLQAVQRLLLEGMDVNHVFFGNYTVLIIAAQFGYTEIMKRLIAQGANVDHPSRMGCTALLSATCYGQVGAVKILLDAHAVIEISTSAGLSAIDTATHRKFNDITLLLSLEAERIRILRALSKDFTQHKLDLFIAQGQYRISWLFRTIVLKEHKKIFIDIILEQSSSRDEFYNFLRAKPSVATEIARIMSVADKYVDTHCSAYANIEFISILLNIETAKTILSSGNFLPKAIKTCHVEWLKAIMAAESNIPILMSDANTSTIQLAVETGNLSIVGAALRNAAVKSKINTPNQSGKTPLLTALSNKNELISIALIRAGADVNYIDPATEVSVLMVAISAKMSVRVISELLCFHADINHTTPAGSTVLGIARVISASPEIIAKLEAASEINACTMAP